MRKSIATFCLMFISLTSFAQNQAESNCPQTAKKAAQAIAQLNDQKNDLIYESTIAGKGEGQFTYQGRVSNANVMYKVEYLKAENFCSITSVTSELIPVW